MSTDRTETVPAAARDEAAKWAARCLSGDMTDREQTLLDEWLQADPRHQESFDAYMEAGFVASEAADAMAEDVLQRDLERFAAERRSRRLWLMAAPAMAASVAAAIVFSIVMIPESSPSRYAAQRGEVVDVNLDDGSLVTLNTNTEIEARFDDRRRVVRLLKGEALFDVARDAERPFVVISKRAEATVLGTRFNVYDKAEETVISVLSGVVEVDPAEPAQQKRAPVTLISGREISVSDAGDRISVRAFEPDTVVSWRRGLATYENEPLAAVIDDLNRYYPRRLVIGDSALNDMPVTGSFDLKDQSSAVEALRIAFSLKVEEQGASRIVLSPDEN